MTKLLQMTLTSRLHQRAGAAGERGAMHHLEVLYEDAAAAPPGWYARPPSDDQMDEMVEWLDGAGTDVEDVFEVLEPSSE